MMALVGSLGIFVAVPAMAQSSIAPSGQNDTNVHHLRVYQMMKDMTQEMNKMTDQMSQGPLTPDQQKQMAQRMAFMSAMMRRLSGLESRPAIKHANMQKQLDQMQKQMDEMTANSKIGPKAK
jgi:hypothetical protein